MEDNVRKELDALRGMMLAWKKDYLGSVSDDGDCEYLAREFLAEVEMHVYPYVRRLTECDYLTGPEAKEFLDFCYGQVEEFGHAIQQPDAKQDETIGG
jgi:hypothetical protein